MNTELQRCRRLLAALEKIGTQEAASLAAGDWPAVTFLQSRAAPLIEHLAAHGPAVADAGFRARLSSWLARRQEAGAGLHARIEEMRKELGELDASVRRARRVTPAYRRSGEDARRWCAVG